MNGVVGSAYITSLLQGELYAIRLACGMVKDMELNRVMIELNSQLAIKLSVSDPPWEVMALVLDVRHFRNSSGLAFHVSTGLLMTLLTRWHPVPGEGSLILIGFLLHHPVSPLF